MPSLRVELLHSVAHQTAATQEVATELLDELLEARLALRFGCLLMRLRHGCADGQEVAHKQGQRLDLDGLVAFETLELP